ncbi:hypothetical protein JOF53_000991 [Crossiella equi]|uniref:Uncharacterized protein n=1 Tax=Crossiella equi TaxID=130796 RepID=A0ABS5A7B7_9PSEU|nr:hypothetical protein [Crossiella equi]MBP2472119.1 hypothetical protein [Crossiella equi]
MLRITADIFSGRPNPVWDVADGAEARDAVRALSRAAELLTDGVPAGAGLGFRGFHVEALGDDHGADLGLTQAYLPLGTQAAAELGERLLGLVRGSSAQAAAPGESLPVEEEALTDYLSAQLATSSTATGQDRRGGAQAPAPEQPEDAAAAVCYFERSAFNPGFWNNDATTLRYNNCYNYASNWRTNTFAQPGRGTGSMYTAITCPEVTRAALHDGMHHRYNCFPDSEKPRYLVALVVAPGPGFRDYHWYRLQLEGYWGHKPGSTPARNTDNSGVVIANPETCNRGPYTQFCGYFYGCNTQRQRIR